PQTLTKSELKFGPILLKKKHELFFKKWERERQALQKIKSHLDSEKHGERLNEINNEINLINEVL
ncbi:tRNA methyltransferase, partial [Staphylococcus cohnii]